MGYKKILALILAVCAICTCLLITASAAAVASGVSGNLTWVLDDQGVLTISGTGAMEDYDPNTIPWKAYVSDVKQVQIQSGITSIGNQAFSGCGLSAVTIPQGVTSIGDGAFAFCPNLTSVTIPNSVASIGDHAFEGCPLTSAPIPGSVRMIGNRAFYGTGLTGVTLTSGVINVGDYAFANCVDLATVMVSDTVQYIGRDAFYDCGKLQSIRVVAANANYQSVDNVLFNKDRTELICYPAGKVGAYTVPSGVTTIRDNAFYGCKGLTGVTILSDVKSIGSQAFRKCGLTGIRVAEDNPSYTAVDNVLFSKDLTRLVQYPGAVTGGYTVPDPVTSIGDWAFANCDGLSQITLPTTVTAIGMGAFSECQGLKEITLPNTVSVIREHTFEGCFNLAEVTIPDSVNSIGMRAFYWCKNLPTVSIPASVVTLGDYAFGWCGGLTSMQFCGKAPNFGGNVFHKDTLTAYYPMGDSTWTAEKMLDYGGDVTWTGYSTYAELKALEVSCDAEVLLRLKMTIPDAVINSDSAYIVLTKDGQDTTIYTSQLRGKADASGRYVLEQGIASGEMTFDVTARIYDGSGKPVLIRDYVSGSLMPSVTRNVVDYARRIMEKGTDKQKDLIAALVTYGGYSQLFFKKDVENPAYDLLPDYGRTVPTLTDVTLDSFTQELTRTGDAIGITQTNSRVFLDSAIYMRLYFVLDSGKSIDDYTFTLTYSVNNTERTRELEPRYDAANNRYYVNIENIAAAYLDYMYTVTVTNGSGSYTVRASAMAWAKLAMQATSDASQINMIKAMYYYNQAANTFFGK